MSSRPYEYRLQRDLGGRIVKQSQGLNCKGLMNLSGLGTISWSPLACGFLTGKYEDGVPIYSRAANKVSLT